MCTCRWKESSSWIGGEDFYKHWENKGAKTSAAYCTHSYSRKDKAYSNLKK